MSTTVTVGESTYTLSPFKGFKALKIGAVVSRITNDVPQVIGMMGDFTRDYESKNSVKVTRQMSVLPEFRVLMSRVNMTDDDWQKVGGFIELPASPDQGLVIAAVFPYVFEHAQHHIIELLALVAATNGELQQWDEMEQYEEQVKLLGKKLLYSGDLSELLELLTAGMKQAQGELGKLRSLVGAFRALTGQEVDTTEQTTDTTTPNGNGHSLSQTPTSTGPSPLAPDKPLPEAAPSE